MCIMVFFRQRTAVAVNGQDTPADLATGFSAWLHHKFSSLKKKKDLEGSKVECTVLYLASFSSKC